MSSLNKITSHNVNKNVVLLLVWWLYPWLSGCSTTGSIVSKVFCIDVCIYISSNTSYSGHAKAMYIHACHIQVMQTFLLVCHSFHLFSLLCAQIQGGFELYWLFGLLRHAEEPQATLGTCQHHSCQQSLTDQGFTAWCFSGEQHLSTLQHHTSPLFSSPNDILYPWQNHYNIQAVVAY